MRQELRNFEFWKGVRKVNTIECDWTEARRAGNELAEEIGSVSLRCFNPSMRRWETMGTFHGNMKYTNAWGDKCILRPDFSGLDFENKKKGGEAV